MIMKYIPASPALIKLLRNKTSEQNRQKWNLILIADTTKLENESWPTATQTPTG
jgi:hypothetical protein